ncbi:glycoside hydrolase family 30 protein [Niveomyces insectorum RCEF 264]|uniref:Glycoside hydrolase family 30 protein n=1 Tax=Niveomyces insectorum RCEF 264 TaxID=1081102 RepID=A0A167QQA2_9HYPO|nr:glycoside hydrolase family 30 protein [Niveomyces insectorum RCEF 264]
MRFTAATLMASAATGALAGPAQPVNEVVYELYARERGGGAAAGAATITVTPATTYQKMDGFGFSLAFQRANLITNMKDAVKQRELLDLLFNTTTGAGFSIIRNGIGSSPDSSADHMNTFAPKNPGGPTATPQYQFDGKDSGQLFVSQEAYKTYGVRGIYADAWSAPGYMKTNGNEANGGSISPAWQQAYADYLLAYVGFYKDAGVTISHLGFLNEPEFSANYASMGASGAQAAAFIKLLHATIEAHNLTDSLGIVCCESEGWGNQVSMTNAIKAAGADALLKAVSSHTYTGGPSGPMNVKVPVWLSEQCDLNGGWSTAWSGGGGGGEGMTWAGNIMNAVVNTNIGGYLYWEGVQWPNPNTNEKLIKVDNGTNTYEVAKRLWAFAQFSRYVRPGATRIGAAAAGTAGLLAVVLINSGAAASTVTVKVAGVTVPAGAAADVGLWGTDNTHNCEKTTASVGTDGTVSGTVPGHGMGTFVIPAAASPAAATPSAAATSAV